MSLAQEAILIIMDHLGEWLTEISLGTPWLSMKSNSGNG